VCLNELGSSLFILACSSDFFWVGTTSLSRAFYFFIIILLGPTSLLSFSHICLMVLLLSEYSIISTKVTLGG
jgi:hypothetical protein